MAFLRWAGEHWSELFSATVGAVSLFATILTIRANTKERKIQNLFALTAAHRELWTHYSQHPELHRIAETAVDLEAKPSTLNERLFVHELILHLRTSFRARKAGMEFDDDAVRTDVRQFFARPIPKLVWEKSRVFQEPDFVNFVESCLDPVENAA